MVISGVLLLVPANYKRFIELIFERQTQGYFKNKYTALLTTSIHFFDNNAHHYIRAVCEDLGMKYTGWFSPDMYDLATPDGQKKVRVFSQAFFTDIIIWSWTIRDRFLSARWKLFLDRFFYNEHTPFLGDK